jgi:hypothetical protein
MCLARRIRVILGKEKMQNASKTQPRISRVNPALSQHKFICRIHLKIKRINGYLKKSKKQMRADTLFRKIK